MTSGFFSKKDSLSELKQSQSGRWFWFEKCFVTLTGTGIQLLKYAYTYTVPAMIAAKQSVTI